MSFEPSSHFFTGFRNEFSFPFYAAREAPAFMESDSMILVLYILAVIITTVVITAIGTRGSSKIVTLLRGFAPIFFLSTILVSIYGHGWLVGGTTSGLKQPVYTHNGIKDPADIRIHIGLHSANITLSTSTLYYNEEIRWLSTKQAELDYQRGMLEGWPSPILRIAEYFSIDEGGLKWMRGYRMGGFIAYICLWAAVIAWIVAAILSTMVIFYASVAGVICGLLQLIALMAYDSRMPADMLIPTHTGEYLTLSYGWSFWLTMVMGLITLMAYSGLLGLTYYCPDELNEIFEIEDKFYNPFEVDDVDTDYSRPRSQSRVNFLFSRTSKKKSVRKTTVSFPEGRRDSPPMFPPIESDTVDSPNMTAATIETVPESTVNLDDVPAERHEGESNSRSSGEYNRAYEAEPRKKSAPTFSKEIKSPPDSRPTSPGSGEEDRGDRQEGEGHVEIAMAVIESHRHEVGSTATPSDHVVVPIESPAIPNGN